MAACLSMTLSSDAETCKTLKSIGIVIGWLAAAAALYFALILLGWVEYTTGLFTWENANEPCSVPFDATLKFWLGCSFQGFVTMAVIGFVLISIGVIFLVFYWLAINMCSKSCQECCPTLSIIRRREYDTVPNNPINEIRVDSK
jgi:hypothetical protein